MLKSQGKIWSGSRIFCTLRYVISNLCIFNTMSHITTTSRVLYTHLWYVMGDVKKTSSFEHLLYVVKSDLSHQWNDCTKTSV